MRCPISPVHLLYIWLNTGYCSWDQFRKRLIPHNSNNFAHNRNSVKVAICCSSWPWVCYYFLLMPRQHKTEISIEFELWWTLFCEFVCDPKWYTCTPSTVIDQIHNHTMHQAHIPQCTSPISHNAPFCNRNVCPHLLQSGALWDICVVGYVTGKPV